MSEFVFYKAGLGNPGSWTAAQLSQIPHMKTQILEGLASGLFISEICTTLGIAPSTVKKWKVDDPDFREAYDDAQSTVTDSLERAAIGRARDGVLEPVVSAGKLVMDPDRPGKPLMLRRYSDGLLQFLLKGRRREVYGDRSEIETKVAFDVAGSRASLEEKFAEVVKEDPER